ncbi:DUF397 domain-containing protein [Streptomyces fradiae]|uniref:DUF397 domain-containing protein n=1 Tax=Streptomyces fradiae TaxID=1906 RepID=UPI002942ECC5|nr:DUF397 domain-containing protein [Streptomyces fradiae]WOI59311.1 DUF397 domain-containing protein [Streptomyces fradiae]
MTDYTASVTSALCGWRKSSHSSGDGGSCIEVLDGHPAGIRVRDSKAPQDPPLLIPAAPWTAFVTALRNGDLPTT